MTLRDRILIHLNLINGIGPATVATLFNQAHFDHIYEYSESEFCQLGLSIAVAHTLHAGLGDVGPRDEELALIDRYNLTVLTIAQPCYPAVLKEIQYPPTVIYSRGLPLRDEKAIALVGSRKAGAYAHKVIEQLIPPLVGNGWTIVSGGAYGVDTMAHRATLTAGGKTIAVLGSGLLRPYPSENRPLFEDIAREGGTVLSSFPLNMAPVAGNFPGRNRVLAGLSRGCVVVQAAEKSGALITARFALEQGREVFAVPGAIDDPLSIGCHRLIQQGAKLVGGAADVLDELGEGGTAAGQAEYEQQQLIE